ncbi:MAG: MG2 domain-containing protein [Thermoanaerobaculia bacterium]|nr:MG2 domain-containing protein [Thermoanaerobaculia bacterium]
MERNEVTRDRHETTSRFRTLIRTALASFAAVLILVGGFSPSATSAEPDESETRSMNETAMWAEVERQISEQKYQAALESVIALRHQAQGAGDTDELLKALVRETQLETVLHGYERTVRFLYDAQESGLWPEAPDAVLVHRLFYAHTLRLYQQAYSWQIRQRERTTSPDADLDQWTMDQISDEIHAAFSDAWTMRRGWGDGALGEMARFLEQNSYPARIRGTLRDSVSHLWVSLLADRSLWSPRHSNEIWKLDVEELLRPVEPDAEVQSLLVDTEVHPLRKIWAILADLEAWHRKEDRPEAAFDARRTLVSRLTTAFTNPREKRSLREALVHALDRLGRDYPWWAMGQADLAEMTAASEESWGTRDGRDLAEECRITHPNSLGGRRCASLVEGWEAPRVSIQAARNDGSGRRSIQVQHANVERLYWRAWSWDVDQRLRRGRDRFDVRNQDLQALLGREPEVSWQVELPPTPDLRNHQTFVTPPLEKHGSYVLAADTDPDFRITDDLVYYVEHRITDLFLFVRQDGGGRLQTEVRSAEDGEPLSGVEVEAWHLDWQAGHRVTSRGVTDAGGEMPLHLPKGGQYRIVARRGGDSVHHETWVGSHYEPPEIQQQSLLYTDRAIYRPGQEIQWKVVAYQRNVDGTWAEIQAEEPVTVRLVDTNGEEVASEEVTTNNWGSASGSFRIPSGRTLGHWTLSTSWNGHSSLRVEEYKRPTFEVAVKNPDESLRFGHVAELAGEARYFFGAPVTDGRVSWRVTRSPILPHWWYWRVRWFRPGPAQVLASGETEVEPDGTFRFRFVPEADPALSERPLGRQVAYSFHIEAEVTDPGGETREGQTTLRAGFITVQATVVISPQLDEDEAFAVEVTRTNLEGAANPGEGSWTLRRLVPPDEPTLPSEVPANLPESSSGDGQPAPYRTTGDLQRPRWAGASIDVQSVLRRWSDGEAVASGTLRHDEQVSEEIEWPEGLPVGAYALRYETRDAGASAGRDPIAVDAESRFVVMGRDDLPPLPLLVVAESPSVEVGDNAVATVHTGWLGQDVLVEVWSADDRLRREVLAGGTPHRIEIPVSREHRGSLLFDVTLVRDHQLLRQQAYVQVPWTDKNLRVELSSFRDLLRPGSEETWTVTVRDADGEALGARAAEVLASMYDRSLDLFAPHRPPSPERSWRSWTHAPGWSATAGLAVGARVFGRHPTARHSVPSLRDDRLIFFDSYPVGGPGRRRGDMMRRSVAKAMPLPASPAPESVALQSRAAALDGGALREENAQNEVVVATTVGDEAPGSGDAPVGEELRTDFSETSFWEPHLLLTEDGSVRFEFEVPDAVTEWRVWLRALTQDFRAGSFETTVRTSKDLLVRPYLPRFFREGDEAQLRVVVSNQGEERLSGELDFDLVDPDTEVSRLHDFGLSPADVKVPFEVVAGGQTTLRFDVTAPKDPGEIAVRVVGRAGDWSDGELRPLPVLPSRLYLSQSRFAVLDRAETRHLRFEDLLADDDPTRESESLVMTLDGQLLTTVLNALPYLVEYPYSCTEQSLNRFVSTGIVRQVFDDHPMVAELAQGLADERDTQYETWSTDDPNRRLLLEETPWLRTARGGDSGADLRKVLDPEIAGQVRDESLDRVLKSQTASGAFPWWPGGPPSPYMTLYVLDSFSRALEFGVEVPQEPVVRAWRYLEDHFRQELAPRMAEQASCCLQLAVYLNWMLSNYPDESWTGGYFTAEDRQRLLDYGFRDWRVLAPRIKGYLALTLQRAGRGEDAQLVWDSVMDSARTDEDLGTYWAPEKMAWLWYHDTIETHAFALRVVAELDPDDERLSGLAQWLLVQKKLNHWKSTRATAEVIYSLVHYLKSRDLLGIREAATVRVGREERSFVFAGAEAEASDRRQQWVIEGDEVEPAMGEIEISKETQGFLLASATWHFATDQLPEKAEGDLFRVERRYFRRVLRGDEWTLEPLAEGASLAVGDQLEVQLDIRAGHAAEYVHLRDPRGAGFEPEDLTSGYRWDGLGHYREIRDSATNFFFEWLPAGQYVLKYRVRAATAGRFRVGPAQLQSMYAPEFVAYSTGARLAVDSD